MPHLPFNPLLVSILAPLAAAIVIACGLSGRWASRVALAGFAVPLLLALHVWAHFANAPKLHGYAYLARISTGLDGLGISLYLGVNGISLPLLVLAAVVGFAAGLHALRSSAERPGMQLALLLLMQAGLIGIFSSVDVFFLYFFHELAVVPTFLLVGIWGGRDRSSAAMTMTIYLTLGAMLSLLGLIALYVKSGSGSFDLITLRAVLDGQPLRPLLQHHLFGLLLLGLGILVSLWPLHNWAPLGYGAAPCSASMLHAGVLKKFGLYVLIQVAIPLLPAGLAAWSMPLAVLAAVGNVLIIGLVTMAQRDLKQMIGYSSVMHMGYAFLGLACGSIAGTGGVILLMVGHGLSVALLFLLATDVHRRTRTFALDEMGGLAQSAPVLAAFFVAGIFASIGLPGFANFCGEITIFTALWPFSHVLTAVAVAGVIISAIYGLRAAAGIFFGQRASAPAGAEASRPISDLGWGERLPALVLLALLLFIGFYPRSISDAVNAALTAPVRASVPAAPATITAAL